MGRGSDRVTGKISGFSQKSQKIHIDIDPSSVNKNVTVDLAIIGDATIIFRNVIAEMKAQSFVSHKASLKMGRAPDQLAKS